MSTITGRFEVREPGVYCINIAGRNSEHVGKDNPDAILRAVIHEHEATGATAGEITVTASKS